MKPKHEFFNQNYENLYQATKSAKEAHQMDSLLKNHPELVRDRLALQTAADRNYSRAQVLTALAFAGFGAEVDEKFIRKTVKEFYLAKGKKADLTGKNEVSMKDFRAALKKRDDISRKIAEESAEKTRENLTENSAENEELDLDSDYGIEENDDPRTWEK